MVKIQGYLQAARENRKAGLYPPHVSGGISRRTKAQHAQGSGEAEEQTGKVRHTQEMLLNLGQQHPSTHGVLCLLLTLEGETGVDCTPVIGYLHQGIEKTLENSPYLGGICYLDNADYLTTHMPMAIEKLGSSLKDGPSNTV